MIRSSRLPEFLLAVVRWAPGEPGLGHDEIRHARLDTRARGLMCAELSDEGAQSS